MCEVWIGPDGPDPVLYSVSGRVKTVLGTLQNFTRPDRLGRPAGYPIIMKEKTNACGDRIVYERPENASGWDEKHFQDSIDDVEDVLAIIAKMQEGRKNDDGEITEPLSAAQIKSILELQDEHLNPALYVLDMVNSSKSLFR